MDEATLIQCMKLLARLVMNTDRIASALESQNEPQDDDTDEPNVDLSGRKIK